MDTAPKSGVIELDDVSKIYRTGPIEVAEQARGVV